MLTLDEEKYLSTLPKDKIVSIKNFDLHAFETANRIVDKVKTLFPNAEILFMGALALKIAGQNDIDIYLLSNRDEFKNYINNITELFGNPKHNANTFIEWDFTKNNYDVELYITDPTTESMQRQIKVFTILKSNKDLLIEYEKIKLKFNGKGYIDYQRAKYEFYNKILTEFESHSLTN